MDKEIFAIAEHPLNPNVFLCGGIEKILYKVESTTREIVAVDEFEDSVLFLKGDPAGFLVAGSFNEVRLYSCTSDLQILCAFVLDTSAEWFAMKNTFLVVGTKESQILVVDILGSGESSFLYTTGPSLCGCIEDTKDCGLNVVSGGEDGVVAFWEDFAQQTIRRHRDVQKRRILCVDKQMNGPLVVVGYEEGTVSLIHIRKGITLQEIAKHPDAVELAFFGREGVFECVVSGCLQGEVRLNWLNGRRATRSCQLASGVTVYKRTNGGFFVGCTDGSIFNINYLSGEKELIWQDAELLAVYALLLSRDKQRLIAGTGRITEIKLGS